MLFALNINDREGRTPVPVFDCFRLLGFFMFSSDELPVVSTDSEDEEDVLELYNSSRSSGSFGSLLSICTSTSSLSAIPTDCVIAGELLVSKIPLIPVCNYNKSYQPTAMQLIEQTYPFTQCNAATVKIGPHFTRFLWIPERSCRDEPMMDTA
jgi:hypothetical protein